MIIPLLILYQVCEALPSKSDQLKFSNVSMLMEALRNPAEINADRVIIPILPNGISVSIDMADHYLVDHFIHVPVEFEIISPVALYMQNMNELPPDLPRFCEIPETQQVKHLQTHINIINQIWTNEIDDYQSFLSGGKHKRAVVQGILTVLLITYHATKFFTAKHDKNLYESTINELTSRVNDLSNSNRLVLMASQEILDLQQQYFCASSKKFSKVQNDLARKLVKDYINQARLLIENSINNQLPISRDVNNEIKSLCEALNDHNAHLCSEIIFRGMKSTFRGLSTTNDKFGTAIIKIHSIIDIPVFSTNQFVSRLAIGNIGFYVNNQRKKVNLPTHAYILNHTDINYPPNTPMIANDCNYLGCPPLSPISNLTPDLCFGAIISLNATLVEKNCHLIDVSDSCVGLHVNHDSFMIVGTGIYTPVDTNLPVTIEKPTIVSKGQFVCPGKVINFRDSINDQSVITLDLNLHFHNFSNQEAYPDQIDQLFTNLTSLSDQISYLSNSSNLTNQIENLEINSKSYFLYSTGISCLSLALTVLASYPLIQKFYKFLCNSHKKKVVKFADPELLKPLRFDARVKSTPNLASRF